MPWVCSIIVSTRGKEIKLQEIQWHQDP
eukprot:Gb_16623 [translate_table: standard]